MNTLKQTIEAEARIRNELPSLLKKLGELATDAYNAGIEIAIESTVKDFTTVTDNRPVGRILFKAKLSPVVSYSIDQTGDVQWWQQYWGPRRTFTSDESES